MNRAGEELRSLHPVKLFLYKFTVLDWLQSLTESFGFRWSHICLGRSRHLAAEAKMQTKENIFMSISLLPSTKSA